MKLKNDFIVIDLEATTNRFSGESAIDPDSDSGNEFEQTNNFIIEIGAVYVSSELKIIDQFSALVRPEESITPFIEKLTGITQAMVDTAESWPVVSQQFESWILQYAQRLKDVKLCAWGNYFDIPLLRRVYAYYKKQFPFSGVAFDVKTLGFLWCAISNRKVEQLNLHDFERMMRLVPIGPAHRALNDAYLEAQVFIQILKSLDQGVYVPDHHNPSQAYRLLKLNAVNEGE